MIAKISEKDYKSYDYKQVVVKEMHASYCIDCYTNFGWILDENKPARQERGQSLIWFKRDRQIINKAELTRLERNFDACLAELSELERSKYVRPTIISTVCGLLGTAFLAGATFASVAAPPIVWLAILLAVPGFLGWILPYFIYRKGVAERTAEITPFINAKHDEIDKICEKGHSLL